MELYIKAIIYCDGNYAENAKIVGSTQMGKISRGPMLMMIVSHQLSEQN